MNARSELGEASLAIAPVNFPLASRMAHKPLHSIQGCLTPFGVVMLAPFIRFLQKVWLTRYFEHNFSFLRFSSSQQGFDRRQPGTFDPFPG
jgi:hypothetical protein